MKLQFDEDMLLVPEEDGTLKIRSSTGLERKIHFLDNSYRKNNQQMFDKVVSLILSQPKYYHWKIKQSREILKWIDSCLPMLQDPVYKLQTKIFWILDDIKTFNDKRVRCLNDDKPFIGKNVRSIYEGYIHEFCSDKCAASFQRTKDRKVDGCLRTMGVTNSMKCRKTVENMQDNFMKNYGVKSPMQHQDFKRRFNDAMLSAYGVEWSLQCPAILSSAQQTCFEHYGVRSPSQAPEIQAKMRRKYTYDGNTFDSSDELAYYIWLRDNGIKFEYHNWHFFEFKFKGSVYRYFPDFYLSDEDVYLEVKGDHFFREDGTMFCPFRCKDWTDEVYEDVCALYEAKRQCMLANGVRILLSSSSEICAARDFVRYAYGQKFIEGCKVTNAMKEIR